jgi:hypothetical protein
MKLLSFTINQRDTFGILEGDRIIDLGIRMPSTSLFQLIQDGYFDQAHEQYASKDADYSVKDIEFLKPFFIT